MPVLASRSPLTTATIRTVSERTMRPCTHSSTSHSFELCPGQVRNGFAELIKISTCAHLRTFDLLDQFCERLIATKFGRVDDESGEVRKAADEINRSGIYEMLKLETPNLHEIGLDRVIAYGHTWSPLHEVSNRTHGRSITANVDAAHSRCSSSSWSCHLHRYGLFRDPGQ
jgi:3-dehydroquinate synthetase